MAVIPLSVNLDPLKAEAQLHIDAQAEEIRGKFITLGAGQSMVYQQKRIEAELVVANTTFDENGENPVTPPNIVAETPHIAREAALEGISLFEQAQVVLTLSYQWTVISSVIEDIRLEAKKVARAAATVAAVEAAQNVDWSGIYALASLSSRPSGV